MSSTGAGCRQACLPPWRTHVTYDPLVSGHVCMQACKYACRPSRCAPAGPWLILTDRWCAWGLQRAGEAPSAVQQHDTPAQCIARMTPGLWHCLGVEQPATASLAVDSCSHSLPALSTPWSSTVAVCCHAVIAVSCCGYACGLVVSASQQVATMWLLAAPMSGRLQGTCWSSDQGRPMHTQELCMCFVVHQNAFRRPAW